VRDFLICQIIIGNAQRPKPVAFLKYGTFVTAKEALDRGEVAKGSVTMKVADHKTELAKGPCTLAVDVFLFLLIDSYVEHVRPLVPGIPFRP
jgi:hypothetical protein